MTSVGKGGGQGGPANGSRTSTFFSSRGHCLVAVTEILPKNSVYPVKEQELQIDGFNIVSNLEVANESKLRGILLYIKSNYSYTVRKIDYQFQEHIFWM